MVDALVIGAGSSGLAAVKNLAEAGIAVEALEREASLGGNWNAGARSSRVYANTHMVSSKPFTQFPDFPMPDEDPDYPHHARVLAYLERYADHFGVTGRVRFGTTVLACHPRPGGGWRVESAPTEEVELGPVPPSRRTVHEVGTLVVANGHNWHPKVPRYDGQDGFTGEVMHAAAFKDPAVLDGRRVVVVGAGNTGCDVAVEAAVRAEAVWHSTRRGYWYAPKYALGRPADQVSDLVFSLGLPTRMTQWLFERTARLVVGRYERLGLPTPDHRFLETHPVVNATLLHHLGHGDVVPVPDIARFDRDVVEFTDGRRVRADLVVLATGYLVRLPFLDDAVLPWHDGRPRLWRNMLPPDRGDLAVIGLIQPDSGQFALVHWQSALLARLLVLGVLDPAAARAERARIAAGADEVARGGVRHLDSTRHALEVAHADYVRTLDRDLARLEGLLAGVDPDRSRRRALVRALPPVAAA